MEGFLYKTQVTGSKDKYATAVVSTEGRKWGGEREVDSAGKRLHSKDGERKGE